MEFFRALFGQTKIVDKLSIEQTLKKNSNKSINNLHAASVKKQCSFDSFDVKKYQHNKEVCCTNYIMFSYQREENIPYEHGE